MVFYFQRVRKTKKILYVSLFPLSSGDNLYMGIAKKIIIKKQNEKQNEKQVQSIFR